MRKPWAVFVIAVTAAIRAVPCEAQTNGRAHARSRSGALARPGRFRRGDWPSPGRPRSLRRRSHPVWPGSIKVVTANDGKKAVDSLKSARADFLKVYTGVSRAPYFGIAEEAKKGNFAFVGHVPLEVDVAEASNAGAKKRRAPNGNSSLLLFTK
jgi:hypothetical protein